MDRFDLLKNKNEDEPTEASKTNHYSYYSYKEVIGIALFGSVMGYIDWIASSHIGSKSGFEIFSEAIGAMIVGVIGLLGGGMLLASIINGMNDTFHFWDNKANVKNISRIVLIASLIFTILSIYNNRFFSPTFSERKKNENIEQIAGIKVGKWKKFGKSTFVQQTSALKDYPISITIKQLDYKLQTYDVLKAELHCDIPEIVALKVATNNRQTQPEASMRRINSNDRAEKLFVGFLYDAPGEIINYYCHYKS